MNELMQYGYHFRSRANMGEFCTGYRCPGWHLSELDTFETCSCNPGGNNISHPECPTVFVVTALVSGNVMAVAYSEKRDMGQLKARAYKNGNWNQVRLREVEATSKMMVRIDYDIIKIEDWNSDH